MRGKIFAWLGISLGLATIAVAGEARTETVRFEKGKSGTTVEGSIEGYESVQYLLGASADQVMTVDLTTDNTATYFNIFEPGKTPGNDAAMFIGSTEGLTFKGELPTDGDYMIQVYMMRSAARRNEVAKYSLRIEINDAPESEAAAVDAKVAGTDFHATGRLACARYEGQPMGSCEFGVKRTGNGSAELTVFWPDGGSRIIFFEGGAPVNSDADEELSVTKRSDLNLITIGPERFEVVDAVISGG